MNFIKHLFYCLLGLLLTSCAVNKQAVVPFQNVINELDASNNKFPRHFGFALKELNASQNLIEINANKSFTAASNTKLLTFYTALNMLGDSVPTFKYIIKQDSLIVWPMGDASFLNQHFKEQRAFDFLKNSGLNIFIVNGAYHGERYGKGWSWDDYSESYQAEITDFPIYGNMLELTLMPNGSLKCAPDVSSMYLSEFTTTKNLNSIKRDWQNNNLSVPTNLKVNYRQSVPLHLSKTVLENLLTDTLLSTGLVYKPVRSVNWRPVPDHAMVVYNTASDSLYQKMLQPSDNFIAEQLLLGSAAQFNMVMSTDSVIKFSVAKYMNDLPNKLQWTDGSGLSRLNLISPNNLVTLLQKTYDKIGNEQRLFSLLPNGGKSGTLRNLFKAHPDSFVFAKSGSLSNNYNLSGFLTGKSGKKYIFSFMNNSYLEPTSQIRSEVERILTFIHEHY